MEIAITKFDGKTIIVPPELAGQPPQSVIVRFGLDLKKGPHTLEDCMGRIAKPKSDEQIDAQLRQIRDEAW